MLVLAIETVTRSGSVALWADGACHTMAGDPSHTHGTRLPGEILDWLGRHGRTLDDVDVFAAASGPGSFTGLRVGLATVQGLALAGRRRAIGVPTLDALAATWRIETPSPGTVAPCLDGQRGDVFASVVEFGDPPGLVPVATRVEPLATRPDAFAATLAALARRPLAVVGDGAVRYADVFHRALGDIPIIGAPRPIAEGVAALAAERVEQAGAPHALRPIYLRRPDAELARERAARRADAVPPLWHVRLAEGPADLRAVEDIQARTFTNPWTEEAIRWELEHTTAARLFVLTDAAGAVQVYCACWVIADELHINSLAVDPARQRQGLGRVLLTRVLAAAAAEGARNATLEVRASNVAARRLYEDQGFSVEGVRRAYYRDPVEDALVLWRRG